MRWNKIILVLCLLVLLAGMTRPEKHMAIEFTDSAGSVYVKWTSPTGVVGLTSKTIMIWYYPDTSTASGSILWTVFDGAGTDADEYNYILHLAGVRATGFLAHWSTTNGLWNSSSEYLNLNSWNHIAVTYNGSSTTNDPIFYHNGAVVSNTEITTPAGTYRSGTSTDLYISTPTAGFNPDGKIASVLIYNRILSAAEILDAYNSRLAIPDWNGLVFAPNLSGAAGLTTFDGATLAAGNTIADQVNGALGVPSGSPLAVADTLLTYR